MFCPECGTKNVDDGRFCEGCGAKLEHPQNTGAAPVETNSGAENITPAPAPAPVPKEPRKPMPLMTKVIIILVLVLAVAGTGSYFVLKGITNPQNIIEDYAKAYVSHDAKALFNTLGFEKSSFITPEKFESSLKSNNEIHFEDATDYTIEDNQGDDADKEVTTRSYTVTFRDSSNAFEYRNIITLNKLSTKSYLFFDNWKIKTDTFLSKDCGISVPAGASVTVDGVALNGTYAPELDDEGMYETYIIPYMFSGTHAVKVQLKNYNDYEAEFNTSTTDYEKGNVYSLNRSDLTLSDAIKEQLGAEAKSTLASIYTAALDEKSFSEAITSSAIEASEISTLEENYDSIVKNHIASDTHLKSVTWDSIEVENADITGNYDDECAVAVSVSVAAEYSTKSVVKSWWTGKKENKEGTGNSTFTFVYHYTDGQWLLHSTNALSYTINYTRY